MSLRIDLTLEDPSEFGEEVRELAESWPDHRRAMLIAVAENLVGGLKREVPTNTSRLQGTIRWVETPGGGIHVLAGGEEGVDYTLPVLHGSEPHGPGSPDPMENRSLSRWADRNNYPGGFQSIYWAIYHYGTEAHDFVTEPLERTERQSSGLMTQVLKNREALS